MGSSGNNVRTGRRSIPRKSGKKKNGGTKKKVMHITKVPTIEKEVSPRSLTGNCQTRKTLGNNCLGAVKTEKSVCEGCEFREKALFKLQEKEKASQKKQSVTCKKKYGSGPCLRVMGDQKKRKKYRCGDCSKHIAATTGRKDNIIRRKTERSQIMLVKKCKADFPGGGNICRRCQKRKKWKNLCTGCDYNFSEKREAAFEEDGEFEPETLIIPEKSEVPVSQQSI